MTYDEAGKSERMLSNQNNSREETKEGEACKDRDSSINLYPSTLQTAA